MPDTPVSKGSNPSGIVGQQFARFLKSLIGDPYQYGGAGPDTFDCSGLVQYGLQKMGLKDVPRTSEAQWAWIRANGGQINKSQLRPGDLIFSQWPGDNASPGHVQVYLGGGQVIQAPHAGSSVSVAPLSADTGHIVGYGRPPGLDSAQGAAPTGHSAAGGEISGLLGEAGTLLHGVAQALDFAFAMFQPGQGWRLAFGLGAAGAGYGAVKAYGASSGSAGGAQFPLAVGLAGASALFAFMALRTWPQVAQGPEKPGAYLAEILEGEPPPPGPKHVSETGAIEAGLAVFAVAWLSQKAASVINTVTSAITSGLVALGLVAVA